MKCGVAELPERIERVPEKPYDGDRRPFRVEKVTAECAL
jgi:hypothetical protein